MPWIWVDVRRAEVQPLELTHPPINILKVIMTSAPKLKWVSTASQENIQTPYLTL
jgi:hypothetical protein